MYPLETHMHTHMLTLTLMHTVSQLKLYTMQSVFYRAESFLGEISFHGKVKALSWDMRMWNRVFKLGHPNISQKMYATFRMQQYNKEYSTNNCPSKTL